MVYFYLKKYFIKMLQKPCVKFCPSTTVCYMAKVFMFSVQDCGKSLLCMHNSSLSSGEPVFRLIETYYSEYVMWQTVTIIHREMLASILALFVRTAICSPRVREQQPTHCCRIIGVGKRSGTGAGV